MPKPKLKCTKQFFYDGMWAYKLTLKDGNCSVVVSPRHAEFSREAASQVAQAWITRLSPPISKVTELPDA